MSEKSKQEIMDATYSALCKHGYADLSIQKIADEFDKGKSLIYYHFDDKEDLMLAFMDHMAEYIEQRNAELENVPADERLDELLNMTLGMQEEGQWEFQKALLEMRAQAPYNEGFAEKFREIDEMVLDNMREIVRSLGAQEPEKVADILVSCIEGAMNRKVALEDKEGLSDLKDSIKEIARTHIVEKNG